MFAFLAEDKQVPEQRASSWTVVCKCASSSFTCGLKSLCSECVSLGVVFTLSWGQPHKVSTLEAARVGVALFPGDMPAFDTAHSVLLIPSKVKTEEIQERLASFVSLYLSITPIITRIIYDIAHLRLSIWNGSSFLFSEANSTLYYKLFHIVILGFIVAKDAACVLCKQ